MARLLARKRSTDFRTDHLNDEQKKIANIILSVLPEDASGGGCQASELIVVHDGGDLARYCNPDYLNYNAVEKLSKALAEQGYFVQGCMTWYSAVYRFDNKKAHHG